MNAKRWYHRAPAPPEPATAGPTANDQLAVAIVAHLAALKPRTSPEQLSAASRMLRCRDLSGVELARATACVDAYAAEEMFFDLATFRAHFEAWFRAPSRAVATTEDMFDRWRRDREEIERERAAVDAALAGLTPADLVRLRDEVAADVEAREPDVERASRTSIAEQRVANRMEADLIRRSDPSRPGIARSMIFALKVARPEQADQVGTTRDRGI